MTALAVCSVLIAMAIVGFVSYQVGKERGGIEARLSLISELMGRVAQIATGFVHQENIRPNGDVIATGVEVSNAEVDQ